MIEDTCGKVQVKGSSGLRGLSLKQIEELILSNIKNDDTLSSTFKRIKPQKGESKRLLYCTFIKNKLPDLWSQYNKKKQPAPMIEEQEILENFYFGANENLNIDEKEIDYYGGDEAEEEVKVAPVMRNRRKEKDPLSGKMAPALQARINAKLRQMKRTGTPMPSFSNIRDKAVFVLALNPKEFKAQTKPALKNRVPTVPRMTFATANNQMTGRLPTKPEKIPPPKRQFSRQQIRTANKITDNVLTTLKGLNENNMRSVLKNRYPNTDISEFMENNANVRNLIRSKELSQMVPAGPPPQVGVGPSFNALPGGLSLEKRATEIRKKKVANQTPRERQILRIVNRMRSARRTTKGPARMPAYNFEFNSNNNKPKTIAPLPKLLQKVNNSNTDPEEPPEKVKIIGTKTFIDGKNVNTMSSPELMATAKMLANKVMPGKKVEFKANDKSRLLRVIKAAAKKYVSMK